MSQIVKNMLDPPLSIEPTKAIIQVVLTNKPPIIDARKSLYLLVRIENTMDTPSMKNMTAQNLSVRCALVVSMPGVL